MGALWNRRWHSKTKKAVAGYATALVGNNAID